MCLYTNEKSTELTAKEDIVCFKFLTKERTSNGVIYHSDLGSYQLGKTARLRKKLKVIRSTFSRCHINEGFHSYDEDGVKSETISSQEKLYKCIIPKGAKYYEGYHNYFKMTGYVSTSLKVIKEMKL